MGYGEGPENPRDQRGAGMTTVEFAIVAALLAFVAAKWYFRWW